MFKMKVTFKNAPGVESAYISESSDFNEIVLVNSVSGKWGKPERWVLHKDEPMAEAYDEADVLAEEEIRQDINGLEQKWVKLKAEYTIEIEDITAQIAQETTNIEALAYLASTDWYIIREIDQGTPCPAEIKQLRAEARSKIVR